MQPRQSNFDFTSPTLTNNATSQIGHTSLTLVEQCNGFFNVSIQLMWKDERLNFAAPKNNCMMTSFYYNYQNTSVCYFIIVKIRATVLFPNLSGINKF